jgi:glycosyltransferase involved in cell wall biosynthesis
MRKALEGSDIPVLSLAKSSRWDVIGFTMRLLSLLRRQQSGVLYTFLTVPNVLGALLSGLLPDMKLVWGVRASNMDLGRYDWFARVTDRLECLLARRADLIIANSTAGREYVVARGFPAEKTVTIVNGIDTSFFARDETARVRVRAEWGLSEDELLIGLAARIDPMKGHETFLRAAAIVVARHPQVRFACVGEGVVEVEAAAKTIATNNGIADNVIWVGPRDDMPAVYSAFDIGCSSSHFGEGFSNSIAEAMSCETLCVATDVGDSSNIVADPDLVAPPADAEALARCLLRLVETTASERLRRGREARARIAQNYDVEHLAVRTENAVASDEAESRSSRETVT